MKILPFQIPKPKNDALVFQENIEFAFYNKLHQHKEIQISLIVKGEGTLIVGDTINNYKAGNIIILGSNLPHVFESLENFAEKSHMITLFFTEDSFGEHFFELQELNEINLFFKQAKHGFKIVSDESIAKLFLKLKTATKLERFISLLQILKKTASSNYESLSSFIYEKKYTKNEGNRMRNVFEFTMNNFSHEITLDEVSRIANMTKNAFCKYFKKRTNKSYFRFLNELRVENASKLMISNTDLTLAEIAYKSGFNNISNFNRQFKNIKKMNPSSFKKNKNS
ncbi:helix-turn-helix transcriptional regulator [Polaribacter aestuariivivens]|uniref:Helix-turn-helix transcriptional regulator n=1 Tax=Polaribacter aestuariivivens TaxID=2304626 RepID=A0A5S3N0J1_9FLAO|nr:AraC family transcriptional regulator [Polaribacter aestuariivivens]TMM28725.1 helix-turn-helix transcriptional regulator [Polaribacter aestuariivivens]